MARRFIDVLLVLAVAAAVAVRVWGLTGPCLDGDEIFSLITVRYGWDHTWNEMVKDAIHPPLFYVLLRGWMAAGGELLGWARLFPAAVSAAAVVPLWLLCRELEFRPLTRLFAVAGFAVNPFLLFYAHHVRMYSLLMMFSLVSLWLLARLLRGAGEAPTRWGLFLANLCMVGTQYYGWVVVCLEGAVILLWRPRLLGLFVRQTAAIAVIFAPWAVLAARSLAAKGGTAKNLGWIDRPGWSEFLWFFVDAAGLTGLPDAGVTTVLAALLPLAGLGALACVRRAPERSSRYFFLAAFAMLPPLVAFGVSQLLPHAIWGHRHLIVSVIPFVLLVTLYLELAPARPLRWTAALLLAVWTAHSAVARPAPRKVPWDTLVLEILRREPAAEGAVPLYAVGPHLHFPFWFFFGEWEARRTGLMTFPPPADPAELAELARRAAAFRVVAVTDPAEIPHGDGWVVYSSARPTGADPLAALQARGCAGGSPSTARDWFQTIYAVPVRCGR